MFPFEVGGRKKLLDKINLKAVDQQRVVSLSMNHLVG